MITIEQSQVENIKRICKIAPAKSPVEALSGVLISASNDVMSITCGDMNIELSANIPCEVESGILTLVNANDFHRALSATNGGTITLKNDHLLIKNGKRQFKLQTLNPESFPSFAEIGETEKVDIDSIQLIESIKAIDFAAARGDVRYMLNGVKLGNDIVALNGHRMAILESPSEIPDAVIGIDVVAKIPMVKGDVFLSDNALQIIGESESFKCKLLDGQYPDYTRMLGAKLTRRVTVDRSGFIDSIKAALITAPADSSNVLFKFGSECSIQSASKKGSKNSAVIGFDCDCSDEFEIAFNGQYILDMVNAVPDESIQLQFNDDLIYCESTGLKQLAMKVRL